MMRAFECKKCGNATPDISGEDPCISCVARRLTCRADNEPPMCFAANAEWLANDPDFRVYTDPRTRAAVRAHAINAWMIIETMRVNRRIARDVKGQP